MIWKELGASPHICEFIDAKVQKPNDDYVVGLLKPADDDGFSYILCEYCNGGTLVEYLMKHECRLNQQ